MVSEDAYVSTREAADILGISLRTAQLWVESGVLLAWKTSGGHRRILRKSVNAMLAERERIASGTPTSDASNTDVLRVVIVEDDRDLCRLMELSLRELIPGIAIRTSADGFTGLVLIGQFQPRLVIADLNMPNMDGFKMINALMGSEFNPERLIVSTALSQADIQARGGLPASVEVLFKPYSLEKLEAIVLNLATSKQKI